MDNRLARLITLLEAAGFFGSAAGAVLVAVHTGWSGAVLPVVAVPLSVLWAMRFLQVGAPLPAVPQELTDRLAAATADAARAAGLERVRATVGARAITATVTWHYDQACITFPRRWVAGLPDDELAAFVRHELAHIEQPRYRAFSRRQRYVRLAAAWNVGFGLAGLFTALGSSGDALSASMGLVVLYALLPVVLTAGLIATRLAMLGSLVTLELDADRQAVAWGAPPAVLLAALEHILQPALRITPPLTQRLLNAAVLAHLPRDVAAQRTGLLRELSAASPAAL